MNNIKIKPYHAFRVDDRFFVLKTRSHFYERITESEYSWLGEHENDLSLDLTLINMR